MTDRTTDHVADIELLTSWEGPAEHAPGVLFEEYNMLGEPALVEFAAWVGSVAISGVIGSVAYDAIKAKVLGVLTAWRRRKGQARLDELKQQVFEEMKKHRANGKLTEEELRTRIEALFAEVRG
jgi:hypothetical protein